MSEYKHGVYGEIVAEGNPQANGSQSAMVIFGTAPVHLVEGGAENVNKPIVIRNMAEARKVFGYSDNWADYTLCMAFKQFFDRKAVAPLVVVNVLDPATHKGAQATKSLTPSGGKITIASAEGIILDSVEIYTQDQDPVKKVKDVDYTIAYNYAKKNIVITSIGNGLGSAALDVKYYPINASAVTDADVIGTTDGMGLNTGIFAIRNVYSLTGMIPAYMLAPGFSSHPSVHAAMVSESKKINGHWDAWIFADIPIVDNNTPITLATAKTWKDANGYNQENETVYFPMAEGADGKIYYLSVLAAANFLELLIDNDDIPYHSASNTACGIIQNLYLGATVTGRVYDDQIINEYLCKHGIASAAFVAGRWAIWGAHAAEYDEDNGDYINVGETNRMMLFYVSNDFQSRRPLMVDQPLSPNDIQSIVAEEQARLDALVGIGALLYGRATLDAESDNLSDIIKGDWLFDFEITTTPLAKSLTAKVIWTDAGFAVYFGAEAD